MGWGDIVGIKYFDWERFPPIFVHHILVPRHLRQGSDHATVPGYVHNILQIIH
jgi:hypothetical protein